MAGFKPFLAPNDLLSIDQANELSGDDYFLQYKVDGIRAVTHENEFKSRSMKLHANKLIKPYFQALLDFSERTGIIVDGEFDSESTTFNDLSGIIRSHGHTLPEDLQFKVFDCFIPDYPDMSSIERHAVIRAHLMAEDIPGVVMIENLPWPKDFEEAFDDALEAGYEGLMVKKKFAKYKFGRATFKQATIFKMKPYMTFDTIVLGIQQATKVDPKAAKKINELGRSETSKKKGDRIPIESASAIFTELEGEPVKVSVASMDHDLRAKLWENRKEREGKCFEWKGMVVGSKDVPRHPMFVRWREDKDV